MTGSPGQADAQRRCDWAGSAPDYIAYHDHEWGRRVLDDNALFERLTLEGFQSGLSWLTILRKRENFRAAFAGFDIATVAAFTVDDRARLLADAGIVRNAAKIDAVINNASAALEVEGGLANLIWSFAPQTAPAPVTCSDIPAQTAESRALSKELKRCGFVFVGPVTAYALMQSTGLVNDHVQHCWVRERV
ncbi:MAG: DNA-3-methyladenine glycosylase I [Nocardioidaceae bacterium]|nr:DNA-3-methyladenine glycosylase I [Nocardioidaceae bacterium]